MITEYELEVRDKKIHDQRFLIDTLKAVNAKVKAENEQLQAKTEQTESICEKHFNTKSPLLCPICLFEERDRLQAENKKQKELIDQLCSQEPCPKCGYGVTSACYGCEIKQLQAEVKQLKEDLIEFGRHSEGCSRQWDEKYRCKCGWDKVEQALKKGE